MHDDQGAGNRGKVISHCLKVGGANAMTAHLLKGCEVGIAYEVVAGLQLVAAPMDDVVAHPRNQSQVRKERLQIDLGGVPLRLIENAVDGVFHVGNAVGVKEGASDALACAGIPDQQAAHEMFAFGALEQEGTEREAPLSVRCQILRGLVRYEQSKSDLTTAALIDHD